MEPPTPLRNADFRSLISSTPRPTSKPPPTSTATTHSPLPTASFPPSSSSAPVPPPKSTKRLEHYQRHLAKQAARHNSDSLDPSSRPRPLYRDRAQERRKDDNPDYSELSSVTSLTLTEESSKFLGGDEAHTHLVKGLDFALLRKKREEEERKEEENLEDLLHHLPHSQPSTPPTSHPPVFHSTMAVAVYDLVILSASTPSDLFLPGRLTYSMKLPSPSPFPLLPLALAAPPPQQAMLMASINELPVSVLVSKDEVAVEGDRVSGFVPPSLLCQLQLTLEKRREKQKRRKHTQTHTQPSAEQRGGVEGPTSEGEEEEREGVSEAKQPTEPPPSQVQALNVEEGRKRLMEADDDDIFAEEPPAAGPQPHPPSQPSPATVPPPLLPPSAVYQPAAPTSKYFQNPAPLAFVSPLPSKEEAAFSPAPPISLLPSLSSTLSSSSPAVFDDEELYPDAAISFSGNFAGDEDSDEEAERLKDKDRAREEKLSAKRGSRWRGGGRGGRGGRGGGGLDTAEMKREERRREAKLNSQLTGVTELLKKEAGKLRLETFEKEGAAQEAAKRLRMG